MILCFTLTMPRANSWDGKWSGEKNLYAKCLSFRTKVQKEKAKELVQAGSFHFDFCDGWVAKVAVNEIDRNEARKIKRKSKGFCGYDWMVNSIIEYGVIKV